MSQTKGFLKLEYLNRKRIIYRRNPINDIPTSVYNWGWYYKDGTYECYELFRSKAKITRNVYVEYKPLVWIHYGDGSYSQDAYIELKGFDIDGSGLIDYGIIWVEHANHVTIKNNKIHTTVWCIRLN